MAEKKRGRGRPHKENAGQWGLQTQIRLDDDVTEAVDAYQRREGFTVRSEAIRRLLRQALKAEGLL